MENKLLQSLEMAQHKLKQKHTFSISKVEYIRFYLYYLRLLISLQN